MKETPYTNNVLKKRFLAMGCKFKKHPGTKFSMGWPDVETRWNERVVNIEVKVDNRMVTKLQAHELKDIAKHGGYALIIRRTTGARDIQEIITGIGKRGRAMAVELGMEWQRLYPKATIVFDQEHFLVKNELKRLEV